MRFSTTLVALLATGFGTASPIEKRVSTPKVNDAIILNYALTLEYLERKFYQEGLANYSQAAFVAAGFKDPFYSNLQIIYKDEQVHVDFLASALKAGGYTPTNELKYCFPATDPKSFITLASVLEGVGVTAYLGAAASIMNKDYLTAAGAILTIESRHSSYIRATLGEVPFPNPFDTPLDFNQVYSLASAFICGGSSPVTLPFMAFPALTLECTQYYAESNKSSVTFHNAYEMAKKFDAKITASTKIYAVFFNGLMKIPVEVRITRGDKDYKIDKIPANLSGPTYIMLSKSNKEFTDENFIAGPAIVEVYPKGMVPKMPHAKCS